ncbi:MAG: hypothetical protein K2L10_05280 [Ruminococcus sp.]|nr:hypothetical protein [Ruminococcus sp.]
MYLCYKKDTNGSYSKIFYFKRYERTEPCKKAEKFRQQEFHSTAWFTGYYQKLPVQRIKDKGVNFRSVHIGVAWKKLLTVSENGLWTLKLLSERH